MVSMSSLMEEKTENKQTLLLLHNNNDSLTLHFPLEVHFMRSYVRLEVKYSPSKIKIWMNERGSGFPDYKRAQTIQFNKSISGKH